MMTGPEQEKLYQELCNLVIRHTAHMTKPEILGVAANIVGKLIAMQDQTVMTPKKCMKIISKNIEIGNSQVFDELNNLPTTTRN